MLVLPLSDEQVRDRLCEYAHDYRGAWKWALTARSQHGTRRSFQDGLLQAAGLREGLEHLASRGSGCPFRYRPRTLLWWLQDAATPSALRT